MTETGPTTSEKLYKAAENVLKVGAIGVCTLIGLDVLDGTLDGVIFNIDMPWKDDDEEPLPGSFRTGSGLTSEWSPMLPGDIGLIEHEPLFAGGNHHVYEGETLWEIAKAHYGNEHALYYTAIKEANGLHDNVLRPGQTLVIPDEETARALASQIHEQQAAASMNTARSTGFYNIVSGDTLSSIAQRSGKTLSEILALNPQCKANPNLIFPGGKIRIK